MSISGMSDRSAFSQITGTRSGYLARIRSASDFLFSAFLGERHAGEVSNESHRGARHDAAEAGDIPMRIRSIQVVVCVCRQYSKWGNMGQKYMNMKVTPPFPNRPPHNEALPHGDSVGSLSTGQRVRPKINADGGDTMHGRTHRAGAPP